MNRQSKKTILLVEDEAFIAMSGKMILENLGYNVLIASSGENAITVFNDNKIDLILMDIDLGKGIDGTEAAAIILKDNDIPVVFLSSHTEPEIVEKTEKITSYGYVVKNSGDTILNASIKMAFKLYMANDEVKNELIRREKDEEKLYNLNKKNELILDTAGEGIYGLDLNGNTTFVNPAAARMIGWEIEEIIGKNQHQLLHHSRKDGAPYPPEECPIYAAFKDGGIHNVNDEVFWRKDGSSFPVEYTSTPIKNKEGKIEGAVVTFKDITERKQAEKKIKEDKEFYQNILNNIVDGVWVSNKDDAIIYANRGMGIIAGISLAQIEGVNVIEDFPEKTLEFFRPNYLKAKETMQPLHYDSIPVMTPSGRQSYQSGWLIPIIRNGIYNGIICTVTDITESKKTEEKIRHSNILLKSSIESFKDIIILSLNREYRYMYFNKTHAESMSHVFGTHPQIGDCIFDHMKGKDDIEKVKAHYDRVLARSSPYK